MKLNIHRKRGIKDTFGNLMQSSETMYFIECACICVFQTTFNLSITNIPKFRKQSIDFQSKSD